MRLLQLIPTLLLAGAAAAKTPPAWNFDEAIISVQSKSGNPFKDKYAATFKAYFSYSNAASGSGRPTMGCASAN